MFQSITEFWHKQEDALDSDDYGLPLLLEIPDATEGTMVSSGTVVAALMWQQYGLDLLHPEVSRWLENNAPDVKYAVARNKFTHGDDYHNHNFRVGRYGTLKIHLSLEIDARFRKVSSDYIRWQVDRSMEAEKGQFGALTGLLNNYTAGKSDNRYFAYQN
jgi:hypothetical protein